MAQADDSRHEKQNWHWRNSMRPVLFFNMDARVCLIAFGFMPFYAHLWAFVLVILNFAIFMFLQSKGMTFPVAMRNFRTWINGVRRPAWVSMRRRRLIDYG